MAVRGLLIAVAPPVVERRLSCRPASAVTARRLIAVAMGLVAPRHVGSSWTRDRTCFPCDGSEFSSPVPPGKSFMLTLIREVLD